MVKLLLKSNKKGQFYLFVAIMLCIVTYGLLSSSFATSEDNTDLNLVTSNYVYEAKNVVNQALYSGTNPFTDLNEFTSKFISYAKTKNMNLQIAYILKNGGDAKVVNYLKGDLNITTYNKTIKKFETFTFTSSGSIVLRYQDTDYNYTFTNESVDLKALIVNN